jgi:hypothetical protein
VKDAGFVQCNLLGDWSAGARGTQGYFAYRDDFAVLAFRGTEKDDWHDLAADLATWPVDEDVTPRSAGRLETTMFHLPSARAVFDSSKVGVHRGFQAALNEVWSDTARNLTEYTGPAAKARSSLPDTASGQLWRHSPSRGLAAGTLLYTLLAHRALATELSSAPFKRTPLMSISALWTTTISSHVSRLRSCGMRTRRRAFTRSISKAQSMI